MRVLHVDTGREWRGGQTQLLHLVRASDGDQVVLPPDAPLRPALEALGIPVGTYKSRLHRATEAMRAVLDADDRQPLGRPLEVAR